MQNNRPMIRNMLFVFQKKVNVTSVNGERKLNAAFAKYTQSKNIHYFYLTLNEFNDLVKEMFVSTEIVAPVSTDTILKEWESFYKSSVVIA
ncbi:hypothetical protein RaK2_00335 [Klebsiella phage vB_KleM_RaK2]|uniref:Uncharacterized protein n=1 Tax=Klebsiella phage vB_KleM_RaK2 TaxID=1147094 RepID=H6X4E2_9CAUD|nr:hypothetical protein F403_gp200 [Klebsiella phage vB_KleM_RaK2]AFA44608.1 hypothetical protein RaK2_00335 [Klebsiella phage vB_KleM_RaK2]